VCLKRRRGWRLPDVEQSMVRGAAEPVSCTTPVLHKRGWQSFRDVGLKRRAAIFSIDYPLEAVVATAEPD